MITSLVTVVHVFVCILLILIVLLQHGKGADMGATFGGGSQTLFGAAGADNLLTRVTTALAVIFMITSVVLAAHANEKRADSSGNLFQNAPASSTAQPQSPAQTADAPPSAIPSEPAPAAAPVAAAPAAPEAPKGEASNAPTDAGSTKQ